MQSEAMMRSGAMAAPATMQSEAMRRSGATATAGDDAERSDDEERRYGRAGGEGDEAMMRSGAADGIRKT
jgi:hypothetical protein